MIYLIRHGLDDERFIGGWSNIDLTHIGIREIEDATNFIVKKNLVINNIVCSDIKRAVTTANIVNKKLNVDIKYTSDLRELDKGDFTGVMKSNIDSNDLNKINAFTIYDKYPRGEAMIDLYERMKIYLRKLKDVDNTLLVTHRGVINMFYYLLNNIDLDMNKEKFNVTHGSIHEMNIEKRLIRRIY